MALRNSKLLLALLLSSCSCEDTWTLFANEKQAPYPLDTTCDYNNPHAEYNEQIPELCDGIDNNCDCLAKPLNEQDTNGDLEHCGPGDEGVDEGCECWPEMTEYSVDWASSVRKCWTNELGGDLGDIREHSDEMGQLYGECEYGRQTCRPMPQGGSEWGVWNDGPDRTGGTTDDVWIEGGCIEAIAPATETCDGLDNNCDGRADEGLKRMCWSGPSNADGTPQNWLVMNNPSNPETPCRTGIELCESGVWSGCQNEILPSTEVCDSLDNDCDGLIDDNPEGQGAQCGLTDAGTCDYGTFQCDGADLICIDPRLPQTEECDGVDNDCDGEVDEGLLRPCESECGSGFETCDSGDWINCSAQQPVEEVCDAEDNDCDGQVDEGLECSCPPEFVGALVPCAHNPQLTCGEGFMECRCLDEQCTTTAFSDCMAMCAFQPVEQGVCDPTGGDPMPEECDAWDNDCDGEIDERLQSACYSGPPGTQGVGSCQEGVMRCADGRWGSNVGGVLVDGICAGESVPAEEVCDRIDNDCDGDIDENLDSHEKVDMVFAIDRSGSMCDKIQALREGIQPYVLEFADTHHRFALVNMPGTRRSRGSARGPGNIYRPDVQINFVDSMAFAAALAALDCNLSNEEAQYDAMESIGNDTMGLNHRADAWPMVVVLTDEVAQSFYDTDAGDVRSATNPCQLGSCEANDVLEVFAIVKEEHFSEWCAPANIAQDCYRLYSGIDGNTIRGYLDDIFSDICR